MKSSRGDSSITTGAAACDTTTNSFATQPVVPSASFTRSQVRPAASCSPPRAVSSAPSGRTASRSLAPGTLRKETPAAPAPLTVSWASPGVGDGTLPAVVAGIGLGTTLTGRTGPTVVLILAGRGV